MTMTTTPKPAKPYYRLNRDALWAQANAAGIRPTMNAISYALDIDPSTLWRALNGRGRPSAELLASIHLTFGEIGFHRIVTVHNGDEPW